MVDADEILVLVDGRVAERGTHASLLAARGVYADMWSMQAEQVQAEQVQAERGQAEQGEQEEPAAIGQFVGVRVRPHVRMDRDR